MRVVVLPQALMWRKRPHYAVVKFSAGFTDAYINT